MFLHGMHQSVKYFIQGFAKEVNPGIKAVFNAQSGS
jgi:hypothetical protein